MKIPKEMPKFLRETNVLNFFVTIIISCLLLYKLATYHWKALEKNYNFVVGSTLIIIHMKKL
jgi:hypothetical protein